MQLIIYSYKENIMRKIINIILYLDFLTNIFTILFTFRVLLMFFNITTEWGVKIGDANIYGILFVYVLLKMLIGFVTFIIKLVKQKKQTITLFGKDIIPWIFFTIIIISFSITLILKKSYNANYNTVYSIIFIIGSFMWLKLFLDNIRINKLFKILYITINPLCNYLILIIGYFISIY
jgi:hypothetical protein